MEIKAEELDSWEALTAKDLPRLRQLTAMIGDVAVGKVKLAGRPICEQELVHNYPRTSMIYQLHVDEPHRNQGIGRALMDAAEKTARDDGAQELLLCVMPDNEVARRMYENRGYEYVGTHPVESVWHLKGHAETVQLLPMMKDVQKRET